jgi:ParB family chromosome partitioning protein
MGHARALLGLEPARQTMAAQEISARKLSVREAERLAARSAANQPSPQRTAKAGKPRDIARLEERLADHLTASVDIRLQRKTARGQAGELAIRFGSLDELSGLLQKLGVEEG